MKISPFMKILLLILTAWPTIYIGFFASIILPMAFGTGEMDNKWFAVHFVTVLLIMALVIVYLILIYKNMYLEGNSKMLWSIGIVMLGMILMPVYWWKHIWKLDI